MAGITHSTPTAASDDPAYDVSADEWNEEHDVADGSLVAAKTAFTATDKVLGRSTAGAGNGEEITVTAAGRALIDDASAAAQLTTLGAAAASHVHAGADITSGTVADARIDAAISRDSELTTHAGAADPHTVYQKESEKGAANGYAGLGAGALVPVAQLASGTPDGTKFVRDDGVLAVPSTTGGTIVIQDIDGTPSGNFTTLQFPNGTFSDQGAGVGRFTPAASGLASGTSFPGSPATDDVFYRTDRDLLYFYDGTRWLTVQEYDIRLMITDALMPASANTNISTAPVDYGANGWYITRLTAWTLVGGTNNGSNFWTCQLKSRTAAAAATNVGSAFDTSADTSNQLPIHTVTGINAIPAVTETNLVMVITKTGAPAALYVDCAVYYRLIG